jgi:hypothetical protein
MLVRGGEHQPGRVPDHRDGIEGRGLEAERARLAPGDIQQVVEEVEQIAGGCRQEFQAPALGVGRVLPEQQFGHADDAVHRGAQLVANMGEEIALDLLAVSALRAISAARAIASRSSRLAFSSSRRARSVSSIMLKVIRCARWRSRSRASNSALTA